MAILVVTLLFAGTVAADDGDDADDGDTLTCNPVVTYLMEETGLSCDAILEYQAQGIGLGQIMRAWYLSQNLPGYTDDWETLLLDHAAGLGWGQLMKAYWLADAWGETLEMSGQDLLDLKESGLGWGQIMKVAAIAGDENFEGDWHDVLTMMEQGAGWGTIRDELGLPPGPPPWAGGPAMPQGKPPWAGGSGAPGQNKGDNGPGNSGNSNGNGPGNNNGNGNGNGNGN
jgi:hypothetical protein